VLLSDGRPTTGGDPAPEAAALDELVVIAPAGDDLDGRALAAVAGGRCVALHGPSAIPEVLAGALEGGP
jgi:hypothetical protein